jgi:hypothetical protein
VIDSVTDRLRQARPAGQLAKQLGQPGVHGLDQRTAAFLADLLALLRGLSSDISLDCIQRTDPLQGFLGKRRVRCDVNVVEFPPLVCPAKRQGRSLVCGAADLTAKPSIAVDLKQTAETFQMGCRVLAFTVLTMRISRGRVTRSRPGKIVGGIAPQPPCLGKAPARV